MTLNPNTGAIILAFFEWKDEYNLGISLMDRQHREIVGIIDELYEAMKNGQGEAVLGGLLARMTTYSLQHFTLEEQMMSKYRYPDQAQHELEHQAYRSKTAELMAKHEKSTLALSVATAQYLKTWWVNHIQTTDRKYVPYMS